MARVDIMNVKMPLLRLLRCSKAFFAFFRIVRSFYALVVYFSTFFTLCELVIQSGKGICSVNSFAAIPHFYLYNDGMFLLRFQVELSSNSYAPHRRYGSEEHLNCAHLTLIVNVTVFTADAL